jgi:hypothetical protein
MRKVSRMIVDAISERAVPALDAERRREATRRKSDSIRVTHSAAYHAAISEEADVDDLPPSRDPAVAETTARAAEVAAGVEYIASASPRQRRVSTRFDAEDAYASN